MNLQWTKHNETDLEKTKTKQKKQYNITKLSNLDFKYLDNRIEITVQLLLYYHTDYISLILYHYVIKQWVISGLNPDVRLTHICEVSNT